MTKTLYISDLDSTLMRNNEQLSEYAATEINKLVEKGMPFTYATGVIGSNEEDAVVEFLKNRFNNPSL